MGESGREVRGRRGACVTTIDLERAAAELRDDGLCIVPGALDADTLAPGAKPSTRPRRAIAPRAAR